MDLTKIDKKYYLYFIGILFIILFVTGSQTIGRFTGENVNDWSYRKDIVVDNVNNSQSLSNYQLSFNIDTLALISSGKMKSDCSDIRFTDSDKSTFLNYWIEKGCGTSDTLVWVKIPNIPSSSQKNIYLYYGNADAVDRSDGENTFILFDDYSGNSIDSTKWDVSIRSTGKDISVSGGFATFDSHISMISKSTLNGDYVYETRAKYSEDDLRLGTEDFSSDLSSAQNSFLFLRGWGSRSMVWNTRSGNTGVSYQDWGSEQDMFYGELETWYIWRHIKDGSSYKGQFLDDSYSMLGSRGPRSLSGTERRVGVITYDDYDRNDVLMLDWSRVRTYSQVVPGYEIKNEEKLPGDNDNDNGNNENDDNDPSEFPPSINVPPEVHTLMFFDNFNWCDNRADGCDIVGSQAANSQIDYEYKGFGFSDWKVASDEGVFDFRSGRSGKLNGPGESGLTFDVYLPEISTQPTTYELSFRYKVSAGSRDKFVVHVTKYVDYNLLLTTYRKRVDYECFAIPEKGDNGNGTWKLFSHVTNPESPCVNMEPGKYSISFIYDRNSVNPVDLDATFIDNLQINVIPRVI